MNRKLLKELICNKYSNVGKTEAITRFSLELGISIQTMYQYLKFRLPKEETLIKITELLEIDFNTLFSKEK